MNENCLRDYTARKRKKKRNYSAERIKNQYFHDFPKNYQQYR